MGGGIWATSSRGRRLRRAFFRERHGHVAARDAEVVGAVRAVVVGAVALCGRGGEGSKEGGRRGGGGPGPQGGRRRREHRRRRRPERGRRRPEGRRGAAGVAAPGEVVGVLVPRRAPGRRQGRRDRRRRRGPVREVQRRRGRRQRRDALGLAPAPAAAVAAPFVARGRFLGVRRVGASTALCDALCAHWQSSLRVDCRVSALRASCVGRAIASYHPRHTRGAVTGAAR